MNRLSSVFPSTKGTPDGSAKKKRKAATDLSPLKAFKGRRLVDHERAFVDHKISRVYSIIRKCTGSLGGGGHGGSIYGEITMGSFQRVIDYLKSNCAFSNESKFLDVGSGLGKPSIHVSIDPGCEVSFGIESDKLRWSLSLQNLRGILSEMSLNVFFSHGDITHVSSFDPFTHIYSFDVGFPGDTMSKLASIFNSSSSPLYLVSFHAPRKIVDQYGYKVEFVDKLPTSMCGSGESHTCYIYKRSSSVSTTEIIDPLFTSGLDILAKSSVKTWVTSASFFQQDRLTRSQKK